MGSRRPDGRSGSRRPPPAGRRPARGRPRSRPESSGPDESGAERPNDEQSRSEGSGPGSSGSDGRTTGAGRPAGPARRRSGLTGRAAILVLVLAALIVSYASSLRAWVDQRNRIAAMQSEVADRTQRVEQLEKELGRWKDPAYVQTQARERFGWVMPGEIGYVVVGDDGKTAENAATERQQKANRPPWYRTLWGSVERAGRPAEEEEKKASRKPRVEPADKIEPK